MGIFDSIKESVKKEFEEIQEMNRLAEEKKNLETQTYADAKEVLMQKLSVCPLLDRLVDTIKTDPENGWIFLANDYYESRIRQVTIEKDMFEIKWSSFREERYVSGHNDHGNPVYAKRTVEDVFGKVAYSYTKSGYLPLHEFKYVDEATGTEAVIKEKAVIDAWVAIVRERLMSEMPDAVFNNIKGTGFTYVVPALKFEDWF